MRLLPELGLIPLLAMGAVVCGCTPAQADAKGDELLRQVKEAVHALEPGGHIYALRFASNSKNLVALDQDERGDQPTYRPGVTLWNTDTWQILHAYSLPNVGAFRMPDQVSLSADGYTFAMLNTFGRQPNIWTLPNN